MKADVFPGAAAELFRLAPTVRKLTIDRTNLDDDNQEVFPPGPCPPEVARGIAASPDLVRLTGLTLVGYWGDEALRQIIASPHLRGLRALAVPFGIPGPGSDFVAETLDRGRFPHLHSLVLANNDDDIGPEHARRIERAAPSPRHLRLLDVNGTNLGDEGAACLARAPVLDGRGELRIDGAGVTEKGIKQPAKILFSVTERVAAPIPTGRPVRGSAS